ncbi:hypothetical protein [Micromonospora sp. RV43]|uniref:hypothetical protein n=1 Tax=Micromonospora sp. RV43 TaxID=1661387 RepID=UPI00064BF089|nr:hypothetical protein [Micromonospora sp. RV43]
MTVQIKDLLGTYQTRRAEWRKHPSQPPLAGRALDAVDELLAALQLRAYPVSDEEGSDDRTEHVVVTVQGVDLSIRGRTSDLFVHIDSGDRDHDNAVKYPLTVEVNNSGENDYPTDPQYIACQGTTCMFNARMGDLDAWEKHNAECPEVDNDGEPI